MKFKISRRDAFGIKFNVQSPLNTLQGLFLTDYGRHDFYKHKKISKGNYFRFFKCNVFHN